jgi:hypothetical protein
MPSLSPTSSIQAATFHFVSAVSRNPDTEAAARDLVDEVRAKLGGATPDLAFVFFSSHHVSRAELLAETMTDGLGARVSLGCSGEGVIAGAEELETSPRCGRPAFPVSHCLPFGSHSRPLRINFRCQAGLSPMGRMERFSSSPIPCQLRCRMC